MVIDLNTNCMKHLPKNRIPLQHRMYLGYVDNYDHWLVVEEWEFRVYNYEYWSWESIEENHEDETWWAESCDYFTDADGCMDVDTCEYTVLKFEWKDAVEMANEIYTACEEDLEDVSYSVYDWVNPSQQLVDFISRGLFKVKEYQDSLVYCYYK